LAVTKRQYPHNYRPAKRNNAPNIGCDNDDTVKYLANEFLQCVLGSGIPLNSLIQPYPNALPVECQTAGAYLTLARQNPADQQCLACIINTLQTNPPQDVFPVCLQQQGARFANGGSSGQLILSKYPIKQVQITEMDSWLLNRINIVATINNIKIGFGHWGFNVMADYGVPGADLLMYGQTQLDHARDFIASDVDVALGDFNSGSRYQSNGTDLLSASGYKALLPSNVDTWCPADKLDWIMCINSGDYSANIDHIFVKDSCKIWGRYNGLWNTNPAQMSDHNGVSATVTKWRFTNRKFEHQLMARCDRH
jgi:hypothetical protein